MKNLKLAIIFGGVSSEHDASLKGFDLIYDSIKNGSKFKSILCDIFYISRNGNVKHTYVNYDLISTQYSIEDNFNMNMLEAFSYIKDNDLFVFPLLLHGQNGEDGNIQGLAKFLDIKGCFGNAFSSSITMDKFHLSRYFEDKYDDLLIPKTIRVSSTDCINTILEDFKSKDLIVKPNSLGASLYTDKFVCNEESIEKIIKLCNKILEFDKYALIQEYIEGDEYTCGCIEDNNDVTILPLVKIESNTDFICHDTKHKKDLFTNKLINYKEGSLCETKLVDLSRLIYKELDLEYIVRVDFIIKENKIYFLEINSLPGLKSGSWFPTMLNAAGLNAEDMIEKVIISSLNKKAKNTTIYYTIDT
jgi:D-alanine-D-alanine ligase